MFKRVFVSMILTLAILGGFFGAQMGTGHDEEPMSQACAAHCLDAALASQVAPMVSPEVFSVFGLLLVAVAGWTLFPREGSEGFAFSCLALLRSGFRPQASGGLRYVRSTVFRE